MKSFAQVIRSLRTAAFAGACAGLMMLSSTANAGPMVTGLDSNGNVAAANGTVDPNWVVYYYGANPPNYANPAPGAEQVYSVVTAWPVAPNGPWIGADGISNWISPAFVPNVTPVTSAPGYYGFETTFNISSGADLANYLIHGRFAVDNAIVYVLVNNKGTGITLSGENNYQQWTQLNILQSCTTPSNPNTCLFHEGVNTLTFLVQNLSGTSGNPVGLRVEIPEPGTLALVGLAMLGFGVARKRKQQ
jgi:hypothetical protein